MRLIALAVIFTLSFILAPPAAEAQQIPGIGVLCSSNLPATSHFNEAFQQGLRDHGYAEAQNVILERRYGEGRVDRMAEIAIELVRMKVDVIVVGTDQAVAFKLRPGCERR